MELPEKNEQPFDLLDELCFDSKQSQLDLGVSLFEWSKKNTIQYDTIFHILLYLLVLKTDCIYEFDTNIRNW